jgi:hypothetical protein
MNPAKHSDEQRLFNLLISTAWLAICLAILIGTASTDTGDYSFQPQSVTTFLVAIPAIWGLYAWRWQSLSELLVPSDPGSPSSDLTSTNPGHVVTNFFGDQLQLRLSWLAQSLANLCLVQLLLTTWRPFLLASLFASLIVVLELSWVLIRMFALLQRRGPHPIHATTISPASNGTAPDSPMPSRNSLAKHDESPESLDPALKDANYHDLLVLRANLEKRHGATGDIDSIRDSSIESSERQPRQILRDERDQLGYGTIQGENRVMVPNDGNVQVVTIPFLPPFSSQPELLAESESELVDSVRVLQCQPLGAKVEVTFFSERASDHETEVILYWEANATTK